MTSSKKDKTRLVHDGRTGATHHGAVNPPVYHASTFLYDSYLQVIGKEPGPEFFYGRHATPTSDALEQAVCNLEGGFRTVLTPSGLNACALSLLAFVETGDHVLLTDSAYQPSRDFCDTTLQRLGIDVTCFDPGSGAEIERLITPKTKVIFLEALDRRPWKSLTWNRLWLSPVPMTSQRSSTTPGRHRCFSNPFPSALTFQSRRPQNILSDMRMH